MKIFENFWCHLTNGNWWFMWLALLAAFLLGLWLGWLIWGKKLKALILEHGKLQASFDELTGKHNDLLGKHDELDGHYKRSQADLLAANNLTKTLENEKGQLYGDLQLAKTDLDKNINLLGAIKADKANVDDQLGIVTTNLGDRDSEIVRLTAALAAAKAATSGSADDGKALAAANAEIARLKADKGSVDNQLGIANTNLGERDGEIARLTAALAAANTSGGDDDALAAANAEIKRLKARGYRMKLQLIEGIGAKREEALQNGGINTFADLAGASNETILGLFSGTTYGPTEEEMNSWRTQAGLAAAGQWGKLHDDQLGLGGGNKAKVDDYAQEYGIIHMTRTVSDPYKFKLQVLEGIGPKIESILHKNNINTFADLVNTDTNSIVRFFDTESFKRSADDVEGWKKQARHADAGKWGDLRDLQLVLNGGDDAKVDDFAKDYGIVILTKAAPVQEAPLGIAAKVDSGAPLSKEEKEAKASAAADKLKASMGTKIPVATAAQKDDLKLISGVGPFIEKKLNALGIYTFEQVSMFDTELVGTVTDAIQFFPGRIQRDNWVGQAAALYAKKKSDPGSLGKKRPSNPEDLKVVEGIGPKIEQLLKNGGIPDWATLANTPVDRLKEILKAAGDRYKMHNPSTWAQQADLANKGAWDELDKLQDYLIGGKDVG